MRFVSPSVMTFHCLFVPPPCTIYTYASPVSRRFFVINQRFDIVFYYFKNIKSTNGSVPAYTSAGVIAQTPKITNTLAFTPTQPHLTFSGVPG